MTEAIAVPIVRAPGNMDLPLPAYQTAGSAAMDLYAAVREPLNVDQGAIVLVPCGFSIAVPAGYEAQIRPRSGLAIRHGLTVVNAPGTIDSDYRGEVQVGLINLGKEPLVIERGMRMAQMLIVPVPRVSWKEVDQLPETPRGAGGFGHTGR
jgi:dUTP pyrophosphatase